MDVGYPDESGCRYSQLRLIVKSRWGAEELRDLFIETSPQGSLCLQNSEFPSPLWPRMKKSPISLLSFALTLFQIATQKSLIITIKCCLWVFTTVTRFKGKQEEQACYGFVCPLAVALPTSSAPPPMQPRCMPSMFSVK